MFTFAAVKQESTLDIIPITDWLKSAKPPLLISGPCSAESEEQVMNTAAKLAAIPQVAVFRAGIWKPRSRPDGFTGHGETALKWLKQVKTDIGIPVAVEVATPDHIELAEKYDIDIYWVGARTVVNPFSMEAVANALSGVNKPVMVKNPVNPDLQLWVGALERINQAGIKRIAAIHRGFSYYPKSPYRNAPVWEIPIELKRLYPELPIITDPSHIAGKASFLASVAQKALDLQTDGLMIETHINPEDALTDAGQQITPDALRELLNALVLRKEKGTARGQDTLETLRNEIDKIDQELLQILARRMEIVGDIGKFKNDHNITILQIKRWRHMLDERIAQGAARGINEDFLKKLLEMVHQESIRVQNLIMNPRNQPRPKQ